MKLGCFPTFHLDCKCGTCVGKRGKHRWKCWFCVSTHLTPQPAGRPPCPTDSAQKWHVRTTYLNQTTVVAISAKWRFTEERTGLRNYAQAREIRLQNGAKVIVKPFYLSGKKWPVTILRISDFSSVDVTQAKKSALQLCNKEYDRAEGCVTVHRPVSKSPASVVVSGQAWGCGFKATL